MTTLKKLIVRTTPFPKSRIEHFEHAKELEEKYAFGALKVEQEYRHISNFLEGAVLESDDDLAEWWIQERLSDLRYHIVHIDMTSEEWKRLGLRPTLYGQSRVVRTKWGGQAISYGRWDYRIGKKQAQLLPEKFQPIHPLTVGAWHEDTHSVANLLDAPDYTHFHFYGRKDVKRWERTPTPELAWSALPFDELKPLTTLTLRHFAFSLDRFVRALESYVGQEKGLLHPVEEYKDYISQPYGVRSGRYPKTGRHVGTDYAAPVGTPVRAPWRGEIVAASYDDILGHFCHYRYEFQGKVYVERYLHLQETPTVGEYRRCAVIAKTGNSGMSTGPHLHQDIWRTKVNTADIDRRNWSALTINPQKHYAKNH